MSNQEVICAAETLGKFLARWLISFLLPGEGVDKIEADSCNASRPQVDTWEAELEKDELGWSVVQVLDWVDISEYRVLHKWIKAGYFPEPCREVAGKPRWSEPVLSDWACWKAQDERRRSFTSWKRAELEPYEEV